MALPRLSGEVSRVERVELRPPLKGTCFVNNEEAHSQNITMPQSIQRKERTLAVLPKSVLLLKPKNEHSTMNNGDLVSRSLYFATILYIQVSSQLQSQNKPPGLLFQHHLNPIQEKPCPALFPLRYQHTKHIHLPAETR
jgi:hypothetical protein